MKNGSARSFSAFRCTELRVCPKFVSCVCVFRKADVIVDPVLAMMVVGDVPSPPSERVIGPLCKSAFSQNNPVSSNKLMVNPSFMGSILTAATFCAVNWINAITSFWNVVLHRACYRLISRQCETISVSQFAGLRGWVRRRLGEEGGVWAWNRAEYGGPVFSRVPLERRN